MGGVIVSWGHMLPKEPFLMDDPFTLEKIRGFSIGHTMHMKGCFGEKEKGNVRIPFILPKGAWPA
ncbi:hypothetical protein KY289_036528 [Solanum tuberosum]|nr:hypothetical protein KY289_036528 [Solanum tuberosum]